MKYLIITLIIQLIDSRIIVFTILNLYKISTKLLESFE